MDELHQHAVHRLHTLFPTGLNDRLQLMALALSDNVTSAWSNYEDFRCGHATATNLRNQPLRTDSLKHTGHLNPNLLLLMGRKHINHPIDTLGGAVGV